MTVYWVITGSVCLFHSGTFLLLSHIPRKTYAIREKEGFSMKNKKKLLSVLLVFVMTVSVFHGYAAKAADTVKVTHRLEQDNKTLVTPVEVTLTDEDKKDYGIDLSTETLTPLHALAK